METIRLQDNNNFMPIAVIKLLGLNFFLKLKFFVFQHLYIRIFAIVIF